MWDWDDWHPTSIPCDPNAGGRSSEQCTKGVTLGVNVDADGNFQSFRYDNEDEFNADGKGYETENGGIYLHDELMLYMYGLMSADEVRTKSSANGAQVVRKWYCLVAGPEWINGTKGSANGIEDGLNGRAGDRYDIQGPYTSFTIDDMIDAFGERDPPAPYFSKYSVFERTASHGALIWLDREYTEAEAAWWTLYMRHHEDDDLSSFRPGFKGADKGVGWGGAGFSEPFLSWRASSRGRGTLRSRIDAVPCGSDVAFQTRSCRGEDAPLIAWPPSTPPAPTCGWREGEPTYWKDATSPTSSGECDADGESEELPCSYLHATWTGAGPTDDMSGLLVSEGGGTYQVKDYPKLWSGGGDPELAGVHGRGGRPLFH